MDTNSKFIGISTVAAVALLLCSVAQADILYSLPLPSSAALVDPGVNAPSPINNAYSPGANPTAYLLGGDVYNNPSINANATWYVDSLTVWAVGSIPIAGTGSPAVGFEYSHGLTLYGGDYVGGTNDMLPVGSPVYTGTQVGYASSYDGSTNYYSSGSTYYAIWEVTFSGLSFAIAPGVDYSFALKSVSPDPGVPLHVTSSCLPQINCNSYGVTYFAPGVGNTYSETGAYPYGDVNVMLTGSTTAPVLTPEPTTWLLFGVGLGVLGLVRRRRG
jgi:hypothetical protein